MASHDENKQDDGMGSQAAVPPGLPPLIQSLFGEIIVLMLGMTIGFMWCLLISNFATPSTDIETLNIIIGLLLFIVILSRYLFLVKLRAQGRGVAVVSRQFAKELIIFISGLGVGFFWYLYWKHDRQVEYQVHLIFFLLVVIYGMSRGIYLSTRR